MVSCIIITEIISPAARTITIIKLQKLDVVNVKENKLQMQLFSESYISVFKWYLKCRNCMIIKIMFCSIEKDWDKSSYIN